MDNPATDEILQVIREASAEDVRRIIDGAAEARALAESTPAHAYGYCSRSPK